MTLLSRTMFLSAQKKKSWLILLGIVTALSTAKISFSDTGFGIPNVLVSETDGTPRRRPVQELEFSTGTVTISGTKATIITGGGSGGSGVFITTSTAYIQNTMTPNTTTQVFNVYQGSFSTAGYFMMDSDNCRWQATISTTGNLVTTLIGCPSVGGTTGQCMGLLCSITYGF